LFGDAARRFDDDFHPALLQQLDRRAPIEALIGTSKKIQDRLSIFLARFSARTRISIG
jgi:hypothetical protein